MDKQKSVVPLNDVDEAFALYSELMPSVTDVRGEEVLFDLGAYSHLARYESRLGYIHWIKETLIDPDEIRQDFDKRYPYREIYANKIYEYQDDWEGIPFWVIVDRRIELHFWTAFEPDPGYQRKLKKSRLLWTTTRR